MDYTQQDPQAVPLRDLQGFIAAVAGVGGLKSSTLTRDTEGTRRAIQTTAHMLGVAEPSWPWWLQACKLERELSKRGKGRPATLATPRIEHLATIAIYLESIGAGREQARREAEALAGYWPSRGKVQKAMAGLKARPVQHWEGTVPMGPLRPPESFTLNALRTRATFALGALRPGEAIDPLPTQVPQKRRAGRPKK